MKRIILIASSHKKKAYPTTAKNMYSESHIFRMTYEYAKLRGDEVYILSPKYGVLSCDEVIDGNENELENEPITMRRLWGKKVLNQLAMKVDLEKDCFEILADKVYYEQIIGGMNYYKLPLKDTERMQWLPYLRQLIQKEQNRFYQVGYICYSAEELHKMCQGLPQYNYLTIERIPFDDGVYIMVDYNESLYGGPRIVRVGTHRGEGRLKGRLNQHFLTEDKNGSILRKYIGSALLNEKKDTYLEIWDMNSRDKESFYKLRHKIDINKERQIEWEISKYLRENIGFYCIDMKPYDKRLELKENIIKHLYKDITFRATDKWLGRLNPMLHIGAYGLWNNELKNI